MTHHKANDCELIGCPICNHFDLAKGTSKMNTREEQIKDAAKKVCRLMHTEVVTGESCFEEGAEWADENPIDENSWYSLSPLNEELLDKANTSRQKLTLTEQKLEIALKTLRNASEYLDGIKYELYGSVYTLEDDEFATVFYTRDICDEALKKIEELK